MVSVDLENNDDCIMVDDDDKSKEPNTVEKNIKFKRTLISQVRKHRSLYDNKHKHFSDVAKKNLVWQQIATKLKSTVADCQDTWFELRYSYQRHARQLRNYFIHGHKENRKRPAMYLETELMFLWRFIENRKTFKIPFEIDEDKNAELELQIIETDTQNVTKPDVIGKKPELNKDKSTTNQKTVDDDLILVEQPVELIVIDEDDDNGKSEHQFKLNATTKSLISQIRNYRELYDSEHFAFRDYTRKSYIWNTIASNLGDKATKLMKCWIIVQTRYEWEICQPRHKKVNTAGSDLEAELKFLRRFILNNPDTVYKQSHYLKTNWYHPIDYFKEIYNLIVRMKKISDIVYITDSLLKVPEKTKQYISLWTDIASLKGSTPGQCEVTWLIMRHFYWELMYMRQQNYQLTDKWYFETIITELYAISKAAQTAKQQELQALKQNKPIKKANKRSAQTNAISLGAPSTTRPSVASTAMQMTPTFINNIQSAPTTSATPIAPSVAAPSFTFPKITAAISLAPQALNTGTLQIKQIPGPPTLSPAPKPHIVSTSTVTTATLPNSTTVPTQMSMSFGLPTQTIMTPLTMPALRPCAPTITQPPAVRNTTSAMVSILPGSSIRSPPLKIHSITWPAGTTTTINPTLKPQVASVAQKYILGSNNSNTSSYTTTTKTESIASFKVTTTTSNNTEASSTNPNLAINSTIATPPLSTSDNTSQLPKITGAVSLLNANEILIELISSHNGNQLVVHGPSLSTKYQLPMPMVAKFIREVLAIPMLHNKRNSQQPSMINYYWEHIGSQFNLPVHICRACWNFLLENFNHFPQIAPMNELMKPFQTSLTVWKESDLLFKHFDEHCVAKGWLHYMQCLPEVVECINGYPVLYKDVAEPESNKSLSDMETVCAWRTISLRFPKIPEIQEIWAAIKCCFCQYMTDLEFGIDNKWPINWWRSFAKLKFLVKARYSSNDPFYYIVSNKMLEEIDRCAIVEMQSRYKTGSNSPNDGNEKIVTELEVYRTKNNDVIESLIPPNTNGQKEVELDALMTAIQKHPVIYGKGDNISKADAWVKVAQELHMEVIDCLLAFKHAVEKYFAYRKQDPVSRCRINERYYKKLDEIVRCLPSGKFSARGKLNVRTPFELNESFEADISPDLVFPERYISDISMSNSPSNLVVKNWVFALGNIVYNNGEPTNSRFKTILKKYLPYL